MLFFKGFSCVWIVICVAKDSNQFQRFAEQPKYTEVNPGQDALLTCKIIDKRGTCSWQKDNKPVGIYPKKYEWAGSSLHLQGMQSPHIGGDCSLWIRSATLDFDDGHWECQVTSSDFTTQDALTSQPVRLVVRVAPQRPRLEHEGVHVPPGHNVTVDTKAVATVKCVSHYGNPPALLKWFLGDQEISPLHPQTNATEPDNPRTWSAASVVQIPVTRERHGEIIKCLAIHESYAAKSVAVEAKMDVKYAPTIRLLGAPQIDLEEGKDSLVLRCEADANPPANIVWRRAGRSEIASLQESLQLRPVGRRDAGLYTCQAQNSVGTSEQLSIQLDIKYPPRILSAGPDRLTTAPLFSPAAFECVGEGNPPPTYKWVQKISHGSAYLERGRESRLVIDNVTYDYQGEYECRATNYINGQERTVSSDPISLQVVGAPQVLRLNPAMHAVSVHKGDVASLSLVVCADPRPRHVAWEWGSLRLEAGSGFERYRVDDVVQDTREDCYLATLHISNVNTHDSRPYYLVVENDRGIDRHAIHLNVEDPLEMSYLLGIAGGCLAALLILICLCIYAIRTKKCCFRSRGNYKSSEKDSEKADLKSRSDSTNGPQLDSIYTTPAGFHHHTAGMQGSPEAMKSTTQNRLMSMMPNYNNADLVLGRQRHHRDLFTGSLGIPDVTTHVGSVIHAFETLARTRNDDSLSKRKLLNAKHNNIGEQPYELSGYVPRVKTFKSNSDELTKKSPYGSHSSLRKAPQQYYKYSDVSFNHPSYYNYNYHHHYDITPPNEPLFLSQPPPPPSLVSATLATTKPIPSSRISSVGIAASTTTTATTTIPNAQPPTISTSSANSTKTAATISTITNRMQATGNSGYVASKNGEIFYHPHRQRRRGENESSNFNKINMDDYRKNLFGAHPKMSQTGLDAKIFPPESGNYDNINFRDMVVVDNNKRQQQYHPQQQQQHQQRYQRPISVPNIIQKKLLPNNSDTTYGRRHLANYRPMSAQFPSDFNPSSTYYDQDEQLLRGSTVSQSFIKNVKTQKPITKNTNLSSSNVDIRTSKSGYVTESKSHKRQKSPERDYDYDDEEIGKRSVSRHRQKTSYKPDTMNRVII